MEQRVHAKKRYGQNFLQDEEVLDRIVKVSGIGADDTVLEIGPGTGALTVRLMSCAKKVVAVEVDTALKAPLIRVLQKTASSVSAVREPASPIPDARKSTFSDTQPQTGGISPDIEDAVMHIANVTVLFQDILKNDIAALRNTHNEGRPFHVVANLPYYITTPVLLHLLKDTVPPLSLTVMVQKEMALRMAASPGNKDYGALSVLVQYYATPQIAFDVPPHAFYPQPKVDSSVLTLIPLDAPPVTPKDRDFFFFLVQQSFAHRRKTLVNSLSASGDQRLTKVKITEALKRLAETNIHTASVPSGGNLPYPIDERVRAERLTMEQFAKLSDFLYN